MTTLEDLKPLIERKAAEDRAALEAHLAAIAAHKEAIASLEAETQRLQIRADVSTEYAAHLAKQLKAITSRAAANPTTRAKTS